MISTTEPALITHHLNNAQQKAALHEEGSLLVIAGAGSGKTRVITARIINLLTQKKVSSSSIVALTFTNKAAQEMRERIMHAIGQRHEIPFIGTFHSYCVRLLKQYGSMLEIPSFSILDEDDQLKIVSGILSRNNLQKFTTARNAIYTISQIKNSHTPGNKTGTLFNHPFMHDIYNAYEQEKKVSRCFDFDDLLLEVVEQFKTKSAFKHIHQQRVRHILVDEYQDTNLVQHDLLKHMALQSNTLSIDSLCAVGDEDQSIYSWRGATIANMRNFQKDFAPTELIKIEQNYRSVQPILDIANEVISHNSQRTPKTLWSEKKGTDRIRMLTCVSEYQEGDAIAQFLLTARVKPISSSIGILYRTHAQSRALEEALIKQSIPYKIIGGIQFYERKEIKDLLAYLRLIVNPFDRPSFFRVINIPGRGLGEKFEQLFYEVWHQEPFLTFVQVAHKIIATDSLKKAQISALTQFTHIFETIDLAQPPTSALKTIINATHYLTYLRESYEPDDAESRIENVQELIDAIAHFEAEQPTTIESFLADVALMQDKMRNTNENESEKVLLMTLHAAKGLEFDTVILSGLEEGIMPSTRSLMSTEAIEEERRLFYVGITRARERLLLTHAKYRYTYGKMVDQFPSRFLLEIPNTLISKEDCTYWNAANQRTFFTQWLKGIAPSKSIAAPTPSAKSAIQKKEPMAATRASAPQTWRMHQPVSHATYGIGTVQNSEQRGEHMYVTVKFKTGVKKIISSFLQII
jgi:DNA helicase-2/ATP-dependent DNA helicase PcrA